MMTKIFHRLRTLVAAAGLLATPIAAQAPSTAKPAMWKLADKDTTIYLFGTIHLLPKGTVWRTAKFDAAAKGSSALLVETLIDEANPGPAIAEMMKLAVSPGLPPVLDRVPLGKRAALAGVIKESGVPAAVMDKIETWAVAFMLLGVQLKSFGLEPNSGVENALKTEFNSAGKSIGQLETNAEQFGFFDTLPEAAQRKFLESVLDDPTKARAQYDDMLKVWARGDVAAMGETFNRELAESPELRENLLRKRNANWSAWLERRMAQPGVIMVAVGAGHLSGQDSVITMLGKRGVKVTRVQ